MPAENRFLQGSFAPVAKEITAFDLPVTGRVPAGLSGRYLRNGPNPLGLDDPDYHWFLGAGMVHGVRLRDGRAEWYRNRWVRSKAVAEALGEKWPAKPDAAEVQPQARRREHTEVGETGLSYQLPDEDPGADPGRPGARPGRTQ
jgi:carotenoid cleavage dioxygenase-like enzyme